MQDLEKSSQSPQSVTFWAFKTCLILYWMHRGFFACWNSMLDMKSKFQIGIPRHYSILHTLKGLACPVVAEVSLSLASHTFNNPSLIIHAHIGRIALHSFFARIAFDSLFGRVLCRWRVLKLVYEAWHLYVHCIYFRSRDDAQVWLNKTSLVWFG